MIQYVMGIEAVGMTFSVGVISDPHGKVIAAVRSAPMSLHTSPKERLISTFGSLVRALLCNARLKPSAIALTRLCIGITGATFRYDRELILPDIVGETGLRFAEIACTGDVEIVFVSHTASLDGSAIICHSGSTAYVVTTNTSSGRPEHFRFGGWGPVLGDEGSGYWIGRKTLRSIGREHDLRVEPQSLLWKYTRDWLDNADADHPDTKCALLRWKQACDKASKMPCSDQYPNGIDYREVLFLFAHKMQQPGILPELNHKDGIEMWRRVVATLARPTIKAAEEGDPAAREIAQMAATHLTNQLREAYDIASRNAKQLKRGPLVLYGGVITHNLYFENIIREKISTLYGDSLEILTTRTNTSLRPACGALMLAVGGSTTGDLRLPNSTCIEAIRASSREYNVLAND